MARTRYASDPGLIARMGATMFLMGLLFVGFGTAIVFLIDAYAHRHGGSTSPDVLFIFAALIGVGTAVASYYWSDKIALRTSGARLVTPNSSPDAARLRNGFEASAELLREEVLTPWDTGIRFESPIVPAEKQAGSYVAARWTDRRGTRWEYRRGEVRQVRDDDPWSP